MAPGVSWLLPDAGIVPSAVSRGPVCVPFQVTSRPALLPLATVLVTVAAASGKAVFQPLKSSTICSGLSTLRLGTKLVVAGIGGEPCLQPLPIAGVEGIHLLTSDRDHLFCGQCFGGYCGHCWSLSSMGRLKPGASTHRGRAESLDGFRAWPTRSHRV